MIKELKFKEFENFVNNHMLSNRYQTINYAMLMTEYDYDYDLIGYFENNTLVAASLIIFNHLTVHKKYGYAPRGFIIDYTNEHLLTRFTRELTEYYQKKNVVFIKINPELIINEIDVNSETKKAYKGILSKNYLAKLGYFKLKDNLYFESRLPRFNGFLDLKNTDFNSFSKNTKNKIRRAYEKGLEFEIDNNKGVDILFDFIKRKRDKDIIYYKHYFNMFKKTNSADIFLISINYDKYLVNSKNRYEIELEKNNRYNELLEYNNKSNIINKKMESDKKIIAYKNDIIEATEGSKTIRKKYIAAAMVIKHNNRVDIVTSGYDTNFKSFDANYYLHYVIIEYYKNNYNMLDLNGLTGDFTDSNPYKGLNRFKLGFNPKVYEYIGEYDLILKPMTYKKLYNNGTLAKVLNKDEKQLLNEK